MMREIILCLKTDTQWLPLLLAMALTFACTKQTTAPAPEAASKTASETASEATASTASSKVSVGDTATLPAQDFCNAYAIKACTWQQRCSPSSYDEACERTLSATCDGLLSPYALAEMEGGSINYNPELAASWLNTLSELPCDSDEIILAPEPLFR